MRITLAMLPRLPEAAPIHRTSWFPPLYIEMMVVAEGIHNNMGTRTAVVDIADHMQDVDRQALDQVAHGDDEVIGPAGRDDRVDDLVHISRLIRFDRRLMQQLLDDIGELLRQGLAHLRTGIFGRYIAAYPHQLVQR